jgi:hypothetical protein
MAHSFKTNSGRSTFGTFREPSDAGSYILNKKAKTIYCKPNICTNNKNVGSESNLLTLNRANRLTFYYCRDVNKSNLNINLITKLNLTDVPVIENMAFESPTTIDVSNNTTNPYLYYTIDPCGNLFGNTICGQSNYLNYQEYNVFYTTSNTGYISNL